jgi:hypothetical protein
MKNFTHSEVETRFKSIYPEGSITFTTEFYNATSKRCHVKFNQSSKEYKYNYNSPIDLIRTLKLTSEEELLNARGLKTCSCGSKKVISINESDCIECTKEENPFLFLLN